MRSVLLKYIASSGREYNLKTDGIRTKTANYHKWEWGADGTALQFGTRVGWFTRDAATYETRLIFNRSYAENKALIEALHDDFELDVRNMKTGRIVWGDYYIDCYILSSSTFPDSNNIWTDNDLTIYCPYPFWIKEEKRSFGPSGSADEYVEVWSKRNMSPVESGWWTMTGMGSATVRQLRVGDRLRLTVGGTRQSDGEYELTVLGSSEGGGMSVIQVGTALNITDGNLYIEFIVGNNREDIRIRDTAVPSGYVESVTASIEVLRADLTGRFLDYPYDYAYDYYRGNSGTAEWVRTHPFESHFKMDIFGPVVNPSVYINGHEYGLFGTIEAGEYVTIDSRAHTVIKTQVNGNKVNMFDLRNKESSIFELIPPGSLEILWSGTFGFDLTIYAERSEPAWSL